MVKEELNQKSPLRKLEAVTKGGVGKGNIGVIASKKGTGKTACLVQLSIDRLLQGKHVIHVSFNSRTDYINTWYEDIFKEISIDNNLEKSKEVHDEMVKNRIIMNFNSNYPVSKVLESLKLMIDNGQNGTDLVIVDGYDFNTGFPKDMEMFNTFAKESDIELWFSDSVPDDKAENLDAYSESIKMILALKYEGDKLKLKVVKHNSKEEITDLTLNPETLLLH